ESRRFAGFRLALGHVFQKFIEELIGNPAEIERYLAVGTLDKFQSPSVATFEPQEELDRVADRRRQQQQSHRFRQQRQREFPDDAAFGVGEAVEFVHDDGEDVVEIERFDVQQTIQQNLRHDDEDFGVGILAAIAGDEADVGLLETPADGGRLQLAELL